MAKVKKKQEKLRQRELKEIDKLGKKQKGSYLAQKAEAADKKLSPVAATVWGLGKVISLEYPELKCVRLDLSPDSNVDQVEALITALRAEDGEWSSAEGATSNRPHLATRFQRDASR